MLKKRLRRASVQDVATFLRLIPKIPLALSYTLVIGTMKTFVENIPIFFLPFQLSIVNTNEMKIAMSWTGVYHDLYYWPVKKCCMLAFQNKLKGIIFS